VALRFDLATPAEIRFGAGRLAEVPATLVGLGVHRVFVVTGASQRHATGVRAALADAGMMSQVAPVPGEPTVELIRDAVAALAEGGCDGVLGLGGGSALDAAKAVAILAAHGTDPLDHLEVVGQGRPFTRPALPCVAVPTTAGTGSEVTRNAVLSAGEVKASLRSPLMLPRVAVVDPDLLVGLGPAPLASGGMDALSQLIEPYLSVRANPFTDALAREGIRRSARALRPAWRAGPDADPQLREDLAVASLFGGLCLAGSGLGAVHGFAAAAGARFGAPHGVVCAVLLAPVLAANLAALLDRAPRHPALVRITEIAQLVTGSSQASAEQGIDWVRRLRADLQLPGLARYGMTPDDVAGLVRGARAASSMRANPIELTDQELTTIAAQAL
jgi:alcohol dehydrogenase class IV